VAVIQANLGALPVHSMQWFKLPNRTDKDIDKISKNFFWKTAADSKGLPIVS